MASSHTLRTPLATIHSHGLLQYLPTGPSSMSTAATTPLVTSPFFGFPYSGRGSLRVTSFFPHTQTHGRRTHGAVLVAQLHYTLLACGNERDQRHLPSPFPTPSPFPSFLQQFSKATVAPVVVELDQSSLPSALCATPGSLSFFPFRHFYFPPPPTPASQLICLTWPLTSSLRCGQVSPAVPANPFLSFHLFRSRGCHCSFLPFPLPCLVT